MSNASQTRFGKVYNGVIKTFQTAAATVAGAGKTTNKPVDIHHPISKEVIFLIKDKSVGATTDGEIRDIPSIIAGHNRTSCILKASHAGHESNLQSKNDELADQKEVRDR